LGFSSYESLTEKYKNKTYKKRIGFVTNNKRTLQLFSNNRYCKVQSALRMNRTAS